MSFSRDCLFRIRYRAPSPKAVIAILFIRLPPPIGKVAFFEKIIRISTKTHFDIQPNFQKHMLNALYNAIILLFEI